mmetsp:Transcript_41869/g.76072  ORF Transcript_41869/g.76072 Transcript_41869/m.76072 type:complete len:396 (-) Transcript_41869:95-1282(-)
MAIAIDILIHIATPGGATEPPRANDPAATKMVVCTVSALSTKRRPSDLAIGSVASPMKALRHSGRTPLMPLKEGSAANLAKAAGKAAALKARMQGSVAGLLKALTSLQREERRTAIEQMSQPLRLMLIQVKQHAPPTAAGGKTSCQRAKSPKAGGSQSGVVRRRNRVLASSPCRGNLWAIRTSSGMHYKVRLTVAGVVITTESLPTHEMAVEVLSKLSMEASKVKDAAGLAAVEESFKYLAERRGLDGDLGLTFQALLDARHWLGRRVLSPALPDIEETLFHRRQVLAAQEQGAEAVFALWQSWSQAGWHTGGKGRWTRKGVDLDTARQMMLQRKQTVEVKSGCRQARSSRVEATRKTQLRREARFVKRLPTLIRRAEYVLARLSQARARYEALN